MASPMSAGVFPTSLSLNLSVATSISPETVVLQHIEYLENNIRMNGSEDRPYVIIVDPTKPEWGF